MSKLTTLCDNWTGGSITVEVDRENLSWEQYDYKFRLEWVDNPEDAHHLIGKGFYRIWGSDWDDPLGNFCVDEGKDPIEAAVRLLCNIL